VLNQIKPTPPPPLQAWVEVFLFAEVTFFELKLKKNWAKTFAKVVFINKKT
jgi:hypothetical protein